MALMETMTPELSRDLGSKLYSMAVNGSFEAAKILLDYSIGRPRKSNLLFIAERRSLGALVSELLHGSREKELVKVCQSQIRALSKFLKTGNPEALKSLPEEFRPRSTSPTS